MINPSPPPNLSSTRPFPVTIILWLGLILTVTHLWETWALIQQLDAAHSLNIDLRWRLGGALTWALIWAATTLISRANHRYAYPTIPTLLLTDTLYNLGWRLLTVTRPSNWATFLLIGSVLTAVSYLALRKYHATPVSTHLQKTADDIIR